MSQTGRVVVAPDKFKGSLTASEAALAIEHGLRAVWPDREIVRVPMADGGEGTVDAFVDAGWRRVTARVSGPLGAPVEASFALGADEAGTPTAVVESAAASGLALLREEGYDARRSSTFGTGQLIDVALARGAARIVVALGGSATNDGGSGMLCALGARFEAADGAPLPPGGAALQQLACIDVRELRIRLRGIRLEAACDVDAPLLGPRGASRVYGPQKGATPEDVETLDAALAHFADLTARTLGRDARDDAGTGAAGGLGFGLRAYAGAPIRDGLGLVAELRGLSHALVGAAWCFTGEGSLDAQTLAGKTVDGVARLAAAAEVRVVAFAGRADPLAATALRTRRIIVVPLGDASLTVADSMVRAAELLEQAARKTARALSTPVRSDRPR